MVQAPPQPSTRHSLITAVFAAIAAIGGSINFVSARLDGEAGWGPLLLLVSFGGLALINARMYFLARARENRVE
ncbi:hypothetical protein [Nocardioides lentus]